MFSPCSAKRRDSDKDLPVICMFSSCYTESEFFLWTWTDSRPAFCNL